jgi:hypothetical protein
MSKNTLSSVTHLYSEVQRTEGPHLKQILGFEKETSYAKSVRGTVGGPLWMQESPHMRKYNPKIVAVGSAIVRSVAVGSAIVRSAVVTTS